MANAPQPEQHSYSYSDNNLAEGKYYYRIKQIDFNEVLNTMN